MNEADEIAAKVIELFSVYSEQLNDLAIGLRTQAAYLDVRTSADIRVYGSKWCLEKYVEADIPETDGYVAAWCSELSWTDKKWLVRCSANISHGVSFVDLGSRSASNAQELAGALNAMLQIVIASTTPGSLFMEAINQFRNESKAA